MSNTPPKKTHPFTKLANTLVADLWAGVRTVLEVFSHDSAKAWPAAKLLTYLKGAEELAREALIEIAETLFVYPVPDRERSAVQAPSEPASMRTPLFRLGVAAPRIDENNEFSSPNDNDRPETLRWSQSISPERDPCEARSADSGSNKNEETATSTVKNRIAALEDVLADPGRHAARMARALYRSAEGKGQRLMARSEHDLLLDHCNYMADDAAYAASAAGRFMQHFLIDTS